MRLLAHGNRGACRLPYERQTHCANGHELTPENVYVGTREDGRQFRQCKPCRRAWDAAKRSSMTVEERQKWRSRFPSQSREKMRGYQQKYRFEKRYGISVHDAKQLLIEQDGLCAICYDTEPATHLDHDHETGKVRGWLCGSCNRALGLFHDDPARLLAAVEYLGGYPEEGVA